MLTYLKAIFPARAQPREALGLPKALGLACTALVLSACSALPPPPLDRSAADPKAHTHSITYRSAIGRFVSKRPVDPDDWKATNERVAPKPKAAE